MYHLDLSHGPPEVPLTRKSSAGPTHPPPPICIFPQTNTRNNLDPVSPIQPEMPDEPVSCSSSVSDSISALTQTVTVIQETLKAMLTCQDVMAKNIQEILLRLNQTGGASQGPETPIEIDVAQSLEELACLRGKTERASGLQEEIDTPSLSDWWSQPGRSYKAYHEGCSF
ncbi:hypothetical protein R3I94_003667 [Phoxinus phoxinus]